MTFFSLATTLSILGLVIWRGRHIPLAGWRKPAVIGLHLAAILTVCFGLWGAPARKLREVPRAIVYLVDSSNSIDATQRQWIARRIASLEAMRPVRLERAVMLIGTSPHVLVPWERAPLLDVNLLDRRLAQAQIDRTQTNLEQGVLAAAALIPPNRAGDIILLSDGRETRGNVTGILSYVRRLGRAVYPVAPPQTGQTKTVWEDLIISPVVQRGAPVSIQLLVFNGAPQARRGEMTVALEGIAIKRQRMLVRPGWHVLGVSVPTLQRGTMALDVELSIPEEGMKEHRAAYTEVEGPPQILFVTEEAHHLPLLAQALQQREIGVAVAHLQELPPQASALEYDAIVLFNIPKSLITQEQAQALREYVEAGGGLLMVGLGGELAHETTTPSPLDSLLPVTFEPKGLQEAKRRVCIVLLIDRSGSMIGPRIAATKRAAVELVKQLSPEDLVGVLAFDTQPYVVVEVQQAGQVTHGLIEKLVKLRSSGGTDVYPALAAAQNRLDLTDATLKHIILLSDGNTPFHAEAYRTLVESFKLSGTTVSTIGVGSAFVNTDYLQWLAGSTGGTFYQMRQLDELPQLVARDTQDALGHLPFAEGAFPVSRSPTTEWFIDTDDWPSLRGYLTATAQPQARVDLTVAGGKKDAEPLLVRWLLGRGRVVSFLSDANTRWSPDWIRWPSFESVWAQVARWLMRQRLTEELFVWVDTSHTEPQLVIEGPLEQPTATLASSESSVSGPLPLVQTGMWRWMANLAHLPGGWHRLTLESQTEEGVVLVKRWIQLGTAASPGNELEGYPPQEALLRQVAQRTKGIYHAPDSALAPPTSVATTTRPALMWWLPLTIILLLVEVALRGSSML